MKTILRALRAFERHWLADALGAVSLFVMVWGLLTIGWVLE